MCEKILMENKGELERADCFLVHLKGEAFKYNVDNFTDDETSAQEAMSLQIAEKTLSKNFRPRLPKQN